MKEYFVFNVREEFYKLYKNKPSELFFIYNRIYYMKEIEKEYGYNLFSQISHFLDKEYINNFFNNRYKDKIMYSYNNNEHINNININEVLERRNQLLEKCRKWLNKEEIDEKEKILFPKLIAGYRQMLTEPIREVMKNKIIPLIRECTPINNSETEWIIFEGGLAKMNLIIRKTIRKTLHIPLDKMTGNFIKKRKFKPDEINTLRRNSNSLKSITQITNHIEKIIQLKEKRQTQTIIQIPIFWGATILRGARF